MTKPHVTVVGSLNVDLSVFTSILPKLGETVTGSSFLLGYGGKGANQCVASRVLGCNTALIGKVGDDYFGEMFIQHLKQLGVNTDGVSRSSMNSTGVASITVETGAGGNQIIIVPGANMLVSEKDISLAEKLTLLDTKVMICQFEIKYPIITLGSKGVIAILSEQDMENVNAKDASEVARITIENQEKLVVHFSAPSKIDVVDTTGAGDCFVGSLAYFVACHEDITLAEQIRRSVWVASQSIRKKGTQSSYLKRDELPDTLFASETFQWP
ncbi:unnamed protein product [Schistosoma spindalis]|nr:unnamed protein product [Schistosoma spindale]